MGPLTSVEVLDLMNARSNTRQLAWESFNLDGMSPKFCPLVSQIGPQEILIVGPEEEADYFWEATCLNTRTLDIDSVMLSIEF